MGLVEDKSVKQTGLQTGMGFCVLLVLLQLSSVIAQKLQILFYVPLRIPYKKYFGQII